jgi:tRNA-2-methylthio-N6-dimethylallyladenosine synthase
MISRKRSKKRRLAEIVDVQGKLSRESNHNDIGRTFKVLIEGDSKRSDTDWVGRSSQNKTIVFPKAAHGFSKGDYAWVKITDCTRATLLGTVVTGL